MTLEVIGSGFGRTGTMTLKCALEKLGFSKCYHMLEVFEHPESVADWGKVARGEPVDWNKVFKGYRASIDWPACHVWRELAARYPNAKVLHTVRSSPEKWYQSFSDTILHHITTAPPADDPRRPWWDMANKIVAVDTFGGRPDDKETAIAAYKKREADVRAAIEPSRLLVYNVAEGWEPLCEFLGVPVPDEPMPHTNTTEEFKARLAESQNR